MAHAHTCVECGAVIATDEFDCEVDRDHDFSLCDDCAGQSGVADQEVVAVGLSYDEATRLADEINASQYQIVNTWNGGKLGRVVVFQGSHNQCFEWILRHTPFSFHEATTRQGYAVERVQSGTLDTPLAKK